MRINNIRIKLFIVILLVIVLSQIFKLWSFYLRSNFKEINEEQKAEQILVTIYYEALCPDSRYFIIKQAVPTLNSIENFIELKLIPYGKAETTIIKDEYIFECQHGEIECEANIIHACSIDKIKNTKKKLEVVACMIKNNIHPMSILKSCVGQMDEYNAIVNCVQTSEGKRLLMKYGEITKSLNPQISFIPTITFDNKMENQILILKNLLHQVCRRLKAPPKEFVNAYKKYVNL